MNKSNWAGGKAQAETPFGDFVDNVLETGTHILAQRHKLTSIQSTKPVNDLLTKKIATAEIGAGYFLEVQVDSTIIIIILDLISGAWQVDHQG